MSHVAQVEVEIKDLAALKTAAESLGLDFMDGQTHYRCWGTGKSVDELARFARSRGERPETLMPDGFTLEEMGRCEHALRIKGSSHASYEIGIVSRRDGKPGYQLLWDESGAKYAWQEYVGEGMGKLKQMYGLSVAVKAAKRQGYRVVRQTTRNDGSIAIEVQR